MDITFKTRKIIIDNLIKEYANQMIKQNYPLKVEFLKKN